MKQIEPGDLGFGECYFDREADLGAVMVLGDQLVRPRNWETRDE